MIFAKIDVTFPRHYRLLCVRGESGRIPPGTPADRCERMARAAALGVWTAALCYSREHMLDGFCPLGAIREFATDEVVEELVAQGLLTRDERDGRPGVVIVNYLKHNESKLDIERRMKADRRRKGSDRIPRGQAGGLRVDSDRIPRPESESEPEPEGRTRLPSQAPAPPEPRVERSGEHQELIAHFVAEFERRKGAKPVIGAKGGAGAKRLLRGRTLAEAKAIVDRALSDPWWLDKNPDLAAIAGKINSFIGRQATIPRSASPVPLQPPSSAWKKAEAGQ